VSALENALAALAASGQTTSYGALARDLGLRMGELTAALEALMEEDAALGRPFRAVLVHARGGSLPARGSSTRRRNSAAPPPTPPPLSRLNGAP